MEDDWPAYLSCHVFDMVNQRPAVSDCGQDVRQIERHKKDKPTVLVL